MPVFSSMQCHSCLETLYSCFRNFLKLRFVSAGFLVSLAVRLLGGEALLNWKAVVAFPWYDSETNRQYFPYKTLCMLIGLVVMLIVSYVTNRLMESGRLNRKWLHRINNRLYAPAAEEEEDSGGKLGEINEGMDYASDTSTKL